MKPNPVLAAVLIVFMCFSSIIPSPSYAQDNETSMYLQNDPFTPTTETINKAQEESQAIENAQIQGNSLAEPSPISEPSGETNSVKGFMQRWNAQAPNPSPSTPGIGFSPVAANPVNTKAALSVYIQKLLSYIEDMKNGRTDSVPPVWNPNETTEENSTESEPAQENTSIVSDPILSGAEPPVVENQNNLENPKEILENHSDEMPQDIRGDEPVPVTPEPEPPVTEGQPTPSTRFQTAVATAPAYNGDWEAKDTRFSWDWNGGRVTSVTMERKGVIYEGSILSDGRFFVKDAAGEQFSGEIREDHLISLMSSTYEQSDAGSKKVGMVYYYDSQMRLTGISKEISSKMINGGSVIETYEGTITYQGKDASGQHILLTEGTSKVNSNESGFITALIINNANRTTTNYTINDLNVVKSFFFTSENRHLEYTKVPFTHKSVTYFSDANHLRPTAIVEYYKVDGNMRPLLVHRQDGGRQITYLVRNFAIGMGETPESLLSHAVRFENGQSVAFAGKDYWVHAGLRDGKVALILTASNGETIVFNDLSTLRTVHQGETLEARINPEGIVTVHKIDTAAETAFERLKREKLAEIDAILAENSKELETLKLNISSASASIEAENNSIREEIHTMSARLQNLIQELEAMDISNPEHLEALQAAKAFLEALPNAEAVFYGARIANETGPNRILAHVRSEWNLRLYQYREAIKNAQTGAEIEALRIPAMPSAPGYDPVPVMDPREDDNGQPGLKSHIRILEQILAQYGRLRGNIQQGQEIMPAPGADGEVPTQINVLREKLLVVVSQKIEEANLILQKIGSLMQAERQATLDEMEQLRLKFDSLYYIYSDHRSRLEELVTADGLRDETRQAIKRFLYDDTYSLPNWQKMIEQFFQEMKKGLVSIDGIEEDWRKTITTYLENLNEYRNAILGAKTIDELEVLEKNPPFQVAFDWARPKPSVNPAEGIEKATNYARELRARAHADQSSSDGDLILNGLRPETLKEIAQTLGVDVKQLMKWRVIDFPKGGTYQDIADLMQVGVDVYYQIDSLPYHALVILQGTSKSPDPLATLHVAQVFKTPEQFNIEALRALALHEKIFPIANVTEIENLVMSIAVPRCFTTPCPSMIADFSFQIASKTFRGSMQELDGKYLIEFKEEAIPPAPAIGLSEAEKKILASLTLLKFDRTEIVAGPEGSKDLLIYFAGQGRDGKMELDFTFDLCAAVAEPYACKAAIQKKTLTIQLNSMMDRSAPTVISIDEIQSEQTVAMPSYGVLQLRLSRPQTTLIAARESGEPWDSGVIPIPYNPIPATGPDGEGDGGVIPIPHAGPLPSVLPPDGSEPEPPGTETEPQPASTPVELIDIVRNYENGRVYSVPARLPFVVVYESFALVAEDYSELENQEGVQVTRLPDGSLLIVRNQDSYLKKVLSDGRIVVTSPVGKDGEVLPGSRTITQRSLGNGEMLYAIPTDLQGNETPATEYIVQNRKPDGKLVILTRTDKEGGITASTRINQFRTLSNGATLVNYDVDRQGNEIWGKTHSLSQLLKGKGGTIAAPLGFNGEKRSDTQMVYQELLEPETFFVMTNVDDSGNPTPQTLAFIQKPFSDGFYGITERVNYDGTLSPQSRTSKMKFLRDSDEVLTVLNVDHKTGAPMPWSWAEVSKLMPNGGLLRTGPVDPNTGASLSDAETIYHRTLPSGEEFLMSHMDRATGQPTSATETFAQLALSDGSIVVSSPLNFDGSSNASTKSRRQKMMGSSQVLVFENVTRQGSSTANTVVSLIDYSRGDGSLIITVPVNEDGTLRQGISRRFLRQTETQTSWLITTDVDSNGSRTSVSQVWRVTKNADGTYSLTRIS